VKIINLIINNFVPAILFTPAFVLVVSCSSSEIFQLQNLDISKKLVENYYESGQFDAECKDVYDDAVKQIERLSLPKNTAVVFDIDETVLSNYNSTKSIGFGYVYEIWHNEIINAEEPAIPQTKIFYDWLISKNIKIIFLTGRYRKIYEATKKNLITKGFSRFDTLIVRNTNEMKIPAAEYKTQKRDELVKKGYNVIACVGDQWSDLEGGNTGIKIKLPNYLYLID
jgi:acid phosphatase